MRFVKILVFLLFYYFKVSGQSFIDNNDWTYHNNLKDVETGCLSLAPHDHDLHLGDFYEGNKSHVTMAIKSALKAKKYGDQ